MSGRIAYRGMDAATALVIVHAIHGAHTALQLAASEDDRTKLIWCGYEVDGGGIDVYEVPANAEDLPPNGSSRWEQFDAFFFTGLDGERIGQCMVSIHPDFYARIEPVFQKTPRPFLDQFQQYLLG